MDYKKLGAAIGVALKRKDLPANVGEFCGVTKDAVYGWAYSGCRPDDKNMAGYFRLIKALKIDISEFASLETPAGRISYLRIKNELSVLDLVNLCKTSRTTISMLESGKRSVLPSHANFLAPVLKTTPDYILNGDKPLQNGLLNLPQANDNEKDECVDNAPFEIAFYLHNIGGEEVNAVNARELHVKLGVGRDFSNWIKERIAKYEFVEGVDFIVAKIGDGENKGFQPIEYFISLDMAKELSMVENNEQGKIARRYFIQCEKIAKSEIAQKLDHLSPEVLLTMKSARNFAKLAGASKREADIFVNEEMKRLHGINAMKLVTGSLNEQLRLRVVK